MKWLFLVLFAGSSLLITSCTKVKKKTKETLNESGEVVGKTAGEFFEGVTEGVEQTLEAEVSLSDNLLSKGLAKGKCVIGKDDSGSNRNKLTVYLIFNKDLNSPITAIVKDKNGVETGRSKMQINGIAGDASYHDFIFDKRTDIESRSKIELK
ncbi:MAG: hypothetical protein H6605_09775 [Flavobacteriales bacterium]|nr:hypothetical protein [Flavobacteriales bacterium]